MSLRSLALQWGRREFLSIEKTPLAAWSPSLILRDTVNTVTSRYLESIRSIMPLSVRHYGKSPKEAGGPPKVFSSMKRRFKLTGSGSIRCMSPGFVHKRFNKSGKRLNRLSKGILVPPTYEKMMKKLGFVSRRF